MFDWISAALNHTGYFGIALLMFAENLFPPIPSELIMPLAGFNASRGDMQVVGVVLSGTAGSLAGALFWYYVGRWLGCDRIKALARRRGRWVTVSPADIDHAANWFRRHCGYAVFFGRLIPTVRTLISVPAGIAGMGLGRFLLFSFFGTLLWTALLTAGGYILGDQYARINSWLNPVANVVVAVIVIGYLYRVATYGRSHPR